MRVFFDQGTPRALSWFLRTHEVVESTTLGWSRLQNGLLLQAVENAGFDVMVTTDQNMRYQQNLSGRKISLVVLGNGQWPNIRPFAEKVAAAIDAAVPGSYCEVKIPTIRKLRR